MTGMGSVEALGDPSSILEPPRMGMVCHTYLVGNYYGSSGGIRVERQTEGYWPDLWAVFAQFLTCVKYPQALPYLTLMVFDPILKLRRLRLRDRK